MPALPFSITGDATGERVTLWAVKDGARVSAEAYQLGRGDMRQRIAGAWARDVRLIPQDGSDNGTNYAQLIVREIERLDSKLAEQLYNPPPPELILEDLQAVEPAPVTWLWYRRIPLETITLVSGDPGAGKSTLVADIAARTSAGLGWPGDSGPQESCGVVIMSGEDSSRRTLVPRLVAAGADLERIKRLRGLKAGDVITSVRLDENLDRIEEAVGRVKARLLIVDPVSSFLGKVDSHVNASVRGALEPLQALADRCGLAVVLVTHLTKSAGGTNALYRSMGSIGFVGLARSGILVCVDRNDPAEHDRDRRRLLLPTKWNLCPQPDGLAFRVVSSETNPDVAQIDWMGGAGDVTADEALAPAAPGPPPLERQAAEAWLRDTLADGPVAVRELNKAYAEAGFSQPTYYAARRALALTEHRDGGTRMVGLCDDAPGKE